MRRKILKGPMDVLVHGQLTREGPRPRAAHAEEAVVRGEHDPVKVDDVQVVVVGEDVVKRDVFDDAGVLDDEVDVLRTVQADDVPKVEQGVFVRVDLEKHVFRFQDHVLCQKTNT